MEAALILGIPDITKESLLGVDQDIRNDDSWEILEAEDLVINDDCAVNSETNTYPAENTRKTQRPSRTHSSSETEKIKDEEDNENHSEKYVNKLNKVLENNKGVRWEGEAVKGVAEEVDGENIKEEMEDEDVEHDINDKALDLGDLLKVEHLTEPDQQEAGWSIKHMWTFQQTVAKSCPNCNFVAESKFFLKKHMKNHLMNQICKVCGRGFTNIGGLEIHIGIMHGFRVDGVGWKVTECDKENDLTEDTPDGSEKEILGKLARTNSASQYLRVKGREVQGRKKLAPMGRLKYLSRQADIPLMYDIKDRERVVVEIKREVCFTIRSWTDESHVELMAKKKCKTCGREYFSESKLRIHIVKTHGFRVSGASRNK